MYKGNDSGREATLVRLFSEAGCAPENLVRQPVAHSKEANVICTLPGSSTNTIVVGAHFDHVSAGNGVVDNWSGASLLPSLFQSLAGSTRSYTFIFIGFAGEERGLFGSDSYVSQLPNDQLSKIVAMVNLDTLGLGPTKVWVSQSDPRLVSALQVAAHLSQTPLAGVNVDGVGESDEESFIARKVCTVTVHSLTPQTLHVLHSVNDNLSAIHASDYYDTYRLLATYLALLDTQALADGHVCNIKPIALPGARVLKSLPKQR